MSSEKTPPQPGIFGEVEGNGLPTELLQTLSYLRDHPGDHKGAIKAVGITFAKYEEMRVVYAHEFREAELGTTYALLKVCTDYALSRDHSPMRDAGSRATLAFKMLQARDPERWVVKEAVNKAVESTGTVAPSPVGEKTAELVDEYLQHVLKTLCSGDAGNGSDPH